MLTKIKGNQKQGPYFPNLSYNYVSDMMTFQKIQGILVAHTQIVEKVALSLMYVTTSKNKNKF